MNRPISRDLIAGLVVFFVALPLCLGIALASGAPLISGLIAGVIGGVLVGSLSGSHTSVSGPAAGLTTVVMAQLQSLGSFPQFLSALMIAGIIQILLGLCRAGTLSVFFPSSVIKGLLAAIGTILVLKQLPHLLGHDNDPEGEFSFEQPDHQNTFSEIGLLFQGQIHTGAMVVGIVSLILLVAWERVAKLKKSSIPAAVVVVLLGAIIAELFRHLGGPWQIESSHLVDVPVAKSWQEFLGFFASPSWTCWNQSSIYLAGMTIALVASLETLLNLEAVDKIDPAQRRSPPNRELLAQGAGNFACGLLGGIPVTSVIVRSSVNIHAGAQSKLSAIFHGVLLLVAVVMIPTYLNRIPLACLAAILIVTGSKLASPKLFQQMYQEGRYQFIPFTVTLIAIVFTDLMIGIGIGLAISLAFILQSNLKSPIRQVRQRNVGGDILHVQLASQVSFLNRAALEETLYRAEPGTHLLLDASGTEYIDPDILSLIRDFRDKTAKAHGVTLSTRGFNGRFSLEDKIEFAQVTTKQLQETLTPAEVVDFLRLGNERFRSGNRLIRDLGQQIQGTSTGQHPLAVILTCIDSRSPAELIFDLGLGDIFTVRIAGNVVRSKVLGSMEYACAVAGAKLIVVMGHTRCGAVNSAIELTCSGKTAYDVTGCEHLDLIVDEIRHSIEPAGCRRFNSLLPADKLTFADRVARANVVHAVQHIRRSSEKIRQLLEEGKIAIIGAMYHIETGQVEFIEPIAS
jgi:carbonic anhydrase